MANYSFDRFSNCPTPDNGHHFQKYNFSQPLPHTEIFAGVTDLKFTKCNLTNCDVPVDAIIEDCLTVHKSFCSHLMPKIANWKTACINDCEHKYDEDEVIIDGVTLGKTHYHKHEREI